MKHRKLLLGLSVAALCVIGFALAASAQQPGAKPELSPGAGAMGIGVGLAIGLGAVGTGIAQSRLLGAAAGVIAERPEMFGLMLVLFALPETLVILGLALAFFLYGKI